jgi:hypothetical protein
MAAHSLLPAGRLPEATQDKVALMRRDLYLPAGIQQ